MPRVCTPYRNNSPEEIEFLTKNFIVLERRGYGTGTIVFTIACPKCSKLTEISMLTLRKEYKQNIPPRCRKRLCKALLIT